MPTFTWYSKTCARQPPLKLTLVVDVERWLSYKGTCHVILLAKLHDMYLYKTDNFFHINHYLKSVSKVALLHRFYCISLTLCGLFFEAISLSLVLLLHLYFVIVFFSPFSIVITSLGKERANFSVFRTFVRFALV